MIHCSNDPDIYRKQANTILDYENVPYTCNIFLIKDNIISVIIKLWIFHQNACNMQKYTSNTSKIQ